MQDISSRYTGARRLATALTGLGVVAGVGMLGAGLVSLLTDSLASVRDTATVLVAGGAGLALGVLLLWAVVSVLVKVHLLTYRIHDTLLDLVDHTKAYRAPMETLVSNSEISDAAKSIAHRAKERETLRTAIREEIAVEDWELAYSLLDEMDRRFGDTKEMASLRHQVDEARRERIDEEIEQGVMQIDASCVTQEWDAARRQAAVLGRRFPVDDRVRGLGEYINEQVRAHKESLLDKWHEAVKRKDIDGGIDILHELDPYLTSEDSKRLEESARGVFHEKLMNLRVQFSMAVKEKRWRDAVAVGESITAEFPNSRMAKEVAESMEALRARAEGRAVPAAAGERIDN